MEVFFVKGGKCSILLNISTCLMSVFNGNVYNVNAAEHR